MAEKKRELPDRYREGAKGHCYWCGRPEGEHKGGKCPETGRPLMWDSSRAGERATPKFRGYDDSALDFPAGRAGRL